MMNLPKWVIPDKFPALYDMESATAIEMVAKLYGSMQTLISEYNEYVSTLNKNLDTFESELTDANKCFKETMEMFVNNFIACVDIKIDKQNAEIAGAIDEIVRTAQSVTEQAIANGEVLKDATARESVEALDRELTVLENRMNTFTALAEGSTTGDAELIDIRNGADGNVYATAGEAVRTQFSNLNDKFRELSSEIFETAGGIVPIEQGLTGISFAGDLEGYTGNVVPSFYVSNKNLLTQLPNETKNGITLTKNDDGTITLNGTAVDTVSFYITYNTITPFTDGTFTLSLNNAQTIDDTLCFVEIQNANSKPLAQCPFDKVNKTQTFTVDKTVYADYMRIRISAGITLTNFTVALQVEEGETATAFVKHEEMKTTLATLGETHDTFEGYNYLCATNGFVVSGKYETRFAERFEIVNEEIENVYREIEALRESDANSKLKGKTIVCFGDSITGNYIAPTDYPSMIASITGATVHNVGFGGCTMSDNGEPRKDFSMCRLVDAIVAGDFSTQENSGVSITYAVVGGDYVPTRIETLKSIDWATVDYITIAYGTNDWNSNYNIDNTENPLDVTSYIGAFRYSIEKLLTAYPNIKVLVLTPLWRWWDENTGVEAYRDSDNYAKGTGWYLYDYGNALIEACKEYHIPYLDLYYECMMNKFNRYEYFNTNDGTHPNDNGRLLLAKKITAKLEGVY